MTRALPLAVRPDATPGIFHVASRSDPGHAEHEVCITNPAFPLGTCQCKDWVVRIGFPLKNGKLPARLSCIHSRRVWAYLYERLHRAQ